MTAPSDYLRHGFKIFPCRAGEKRPATRHGFNDSLELDHRRDHDEMCTIVDDLFEEKGYNIGLVTGHRVDVLDVDVKDAKPGLVALATLRAAGLLEGYLFMARTPSGGVHLYFPASGGRGGSIPKHGLDFKALGGYVLAPPSSLFDVVEGTINIGAYSWIDRQPGPGRPLDWKACRGVLGVSESIVSTSTPSSDFTLEGLCKYLASQPINRNGALYWAACRAIESGYTETQLDELIHASLSMSLPGEDRESECRATVRSAMKAPA